MDKNYKKNSLVISQYTSANVPPLEDICEKNASCW